MPENISLGQLGSEQNLVPAEKPVDLNVENPLNTDSVTTKSVNLDTVEINDSGLIGDNSTETQSISEIAISGDIEQNTASLHTVTLGSKIKTFFLGDPPPGHGINVSGEPDLESLAAEQA